MITTVELDNLNAVSHELRIQLDTLRFHQKVDLIELLSIDTLIATSLGSSALLDLDKPSQRRAFGFMGDATIASEILEDVIDSGEGGLPLQGAVRNTIAAFQSALELVSREAIKEFERITA